jgi:hypothetical protein
MVSKGRETWEHPEINGKVSFKTSEYRKELAKRSP